MTLAAFASILLLHLMGAMSPGPAFVMTVRTAAVEGFRPAAFAALGLATGAVIWALAALLGLTALFQVAPAALLALKLAGAAYLIWLALQMLRHAEAPLPQVEAEGPTPRTIGSAFRLGLLTQLANPKIAVFFGAVFVGMVPQDASVLAMAAILAMIFVNEALWYGFVGRVFSLTWVRAAYGRAKRWVDRAFGVLIGGFGIKIAAT